MKKQLLLLLALLTFSVGSMAQSVSYLGKTVTYTKKADTVTVIMNDAKKTTLKFPGSTSMPTAVQVLAAYKKAMAVPVSDVVIVGTGSGNLEIVNLANKKIKIKKGNYNFLYLNALSKVSIDATEAVLNKNGSVEIGTGDGIELFGVKITNGHFFRAIQIKGYNSNLYLHDIAFKDISDYTITNEYRVDYIPGNTKTSFNNWKFERLSFDNCNTPFQAGGGVNDKTGGVSCLYNNFKFINSTFKNSGGSIAWMGASEGFEFAFNTIDSHNLKDIGSSPAAINGTHNRMFDLSGYGDVHDNKVTNSQGNLIGIRNVSFTGNGKPTNIYNNTYYNSWKYSAFEIQPWGFYEGLAASGKIKYTAVNVFNNTVGHMNTSKDWEGQILDLYNSHSEVYFYNNLGFDLNRANGRETTDMINYNGNSDPIVNPKGLITEQTKYYYGNQYFYDWTKSVKDLTTFESLFPGIGAPKK